MTLITVLQSILIFLMLKSVPSGLHPNGIEPNGIEPTPLGSIPWLPLKSCQAFCVNKKMFFKNEVFLHLG